MPETLDEQILGVLSDALYYKRDYDLWITNRRIVGALLGYSGWIPAGVGLVATAAYLGGQGERRQRYANLTLEQIFSADPKNFAIPLSWIERAVFSGGINVLAMPALRLWIQGKEAKFEFTHSMFGKDQQQLRYATDLLSRALPGRITFKRI